MLHNLFQKHVDLTGSRSFLEIGCGPGYVLKGLSDFSDLRMTGSDVHIEGLRFAAKRLPQIEFIQCDATQIPFSEEFDVVGAFDVLEHIEDDVSVMGSVLRALKPRGLFFITVPQHKFLWSSVDEFGCHKRRYSRKQLKEKLAASGFRIESWSSFVFTLFPLLLASRLMKKNQRVGHAKSEVAAIELQLPRIVNSMLELFMRVDEFLIRNGVSLPFGGSLIVVARKSHL